MLSPDTKINDLVVSTRLRFFLRKLAAPDTTLQDIVTDNTRQGLLRMPALGKISFAELESILQSAGLSLSDEPSPVNTRQIESDSIRAFFTAERRRMVSLRGIEEVAGLPYRTLDHFLAGRRNLPSVYLDNLTRMLTLLGYQPATTDHQIL